MAVLYSAFLAIVALTSAKTHDDPFQEFTSRFHRVYATEAERLLRRRAFDRNMVVAAKLQERNPSATYGALSPFADQTEEELVARFPALPVGGEARDLLLNSTRDLGEPPAAFDSQANGDVTEIKDQGEPKGGCNSCWAHVVAGVLETGVAWQHSGKLVSLSPQQLIDCDHRDDGCVSGNMGNALTWMEEMSYGLERLDEYPYTAEKGPTCLGSRSKMVVYPRTHYRLQYNQMVQACFQFGALAAGLNAKPIALNTGGLIDLSRFDCNPKEQTHAVTIIGYGTQGGILFWRFKNSWGTIWGDRGFGRIRRGGNTCGIETYVIGTKVVAPKADMVVV